MQGLDEAFIEEVLNILKNSIGDLNTSQEMDTYYKTNINIAISDLSTDDISEEVFKTELGKTTIVVYAMLLIKEQEVATNPTLLMLRNRLADITKGARHKDV